MGDNVLQVVRGDIFLIPIGVSHVYRPTSTAKDRSLVVYNCIIKLEALTQLLHAFPGGIDLLSILTHKQIRRYLDRNGEFHRLFQQVLEEYSTNRMGREAALYRHCQSSCLFVQM
ncbi:hypothetical protein MRBLPE1_000907 [Paenibacillus sp. LPE1-1-1.1]